MHQAPRGYVDPNHAFDVSKILATELAMCRSSLYQPLRARMTNSGGHFGDLRGLHEIVGHFGCQVLSIVGLHTHWSTFAAGEIAR